MLEEIRLVISQHLEIPKKQNVNKQLWKMDMKQKNKIKLNDGYMEQEL